VFFAIYITAGIGYMKWFFIILLTQTQGDLHEGFLWYDPMFDNKDECIAWVNNNPCS